MNQESPATSMAHSTASVKIIMENLNSHQLKLIFTAVRKYQKGMIGNPTCRKQYRELNEILDILQPYAYGSSYLEWDNEGI
jgi:flavorubredoxin